MFLVSLIRLNLQWHGDSFSVLTEWGYGMKSIYLLISILTVSIWVFLDEIRIKNGKLHETG